MRESRSFKKLPSISLAVICAIAVAAFVIGTNLDGSSGPPAPSDTIGDAFRVTRHGPMPSSWLTASTSNSTCWVAKPAEKGFMRQTNASRIAAGKTKLRLDPELSQVARKHTREMTATNLLHHTTEDALRRRVTFWSSLGENVGVGATVDSLHVAFMNSPAHKDNIVHGSFRHAGIGTAESGGRLWVTVIFQERDNPGTTLRMPRC